MRPGRPGLRPRRASSVGLQWRTRGRGGRPWSAWRAGGPVGCEPGGRGRQGRPRGRRAPGEDPADEGYNPRPRSPILISSQLEARVQPKGAIAQMNPRKLITTLFALALLAGAGVA